MRHLSLCGAAAGFGLALLALGVEAQPIPPRIEPPAPPPSPRIQLPRIQLPGTGGAPSVLVRTLELRDIALGTPDTGALSVGRITFKGLAPGAEAVRAERVELENVVIEIGPRKIELPEAAVSGLEIPVSLFRALTEGGTAKLDWSALIQQIALAELSVPQAVDRQSAFSLKSEYGGLTLRDFKNGVLGSVQIERTATEQTDAAQQLTAISGQTRMRGVNVAELVRFATGGGSAGDAVRLVEHVTARGVQIVMPDLAVEVENVEMAGVDGRAPAAAAIASPALVEAPRIVIPGRQDDDAQRRMARDARDIVRNARVARYSLEGVRFRSAEHGNFAIAGIALNNFGGRGLDLLEIKGFDLSSPVTSVKFERFAIEKFSYGELLDLALEAAASGKEPDFSTVNWADLTPRIGAIRLARLALETPAGPLDLDEFRYEVDDPAVALPEKMTLALNGLKVDLGRMPPNDLRDKLVALGYGTLVGSSQANLRWLPKERAFTIENTGVSVDGIGRFDFSFRFGDADLAGATAKPDEADEILGKARFEQGSLRIVNLGLAERLFAELARGSGMPEREVRAAVAAEMRAQAIAAFGPALAPGSENAIETFLRTTSRIALRAAPRPGAPALTLSDLDTNDPASLLDRITIAIEIPPN